MGVRLYGSSLTPEQTEEAARLSEADNPVKRFAHVLGRGETGVRNARIRAGVRQRDTHERVRGSTSAYHE